jgi:hypothetical protein
MFFSIPPLMILIPATLPFSVQIAPASVGLRAVIAPVVDRFVQPCFRLFDRVLAPLSVVGVHQRCRYKQ